MSLNVGRLPIRTALRHCTWLPPPRPLGISNANAAGNLQFPSQHLHEHYSKRSDNTRAQRGRCLTAEGETPLSYCARLTARKPVCATTAIHFARSATRQASIGAGFSGGVASLQQLAIIAYGGPSRLEAGGSKRAKGAALQTAGRGIRERSDAERRDSAGCRRTGGWLLHVSLRTDWTAKRKTEEVRFSWPLGCLQVHCDCREEADALSRPDGYHGQRAAELTIFSLPGDSLAQPFSSTPL